MFLSCMHYMPYVYICFYHACTICPMYTYACHARNARIESHMQQPHLHQGVTNMTKKTDRADQPDEHVPGARWRWCCSCSTCTWGLCHSSFKTRNGGRARRFICECIPLHFLFILILFILNLFFYLFIFVVVVVCPCSVLSSWLVGFHNLKIKCGRKMSVCENLVLEPIDPPP